MTGTRTERELRDVPVRTEVISRVELETIHARNLVEALRYHPGVHLNKIHGKSGYEIAMQGVGADRVLILIDGRPVSPSTGSTVDLSQLSVSEIDHIEVVKGAASALYGSSAMGGVVNIITRNPEPGLSYSTTVDVGSWGDKNLGGSEAAARHIALSGDYKGDAWYTSLSYDLRDSDGFDLDPDTYTTTGDEGGKWNLDLELGYQFDDGTRLSYKPARYEEDLSRLTGEFLPGTGVIKKTKTEVVEKQTHSLNFDKTFASESALSVYFVTEKLDDQTALDVNATGDVVEGQRHATLNFDKFELQFNQPIGERQILTTGLVLFNNELEQTREGRSETLPQLNHENIEAFVQHDIFIGEHWELLPGIRFQDDSDFGAHTAAKVNAMYFNDTWFDSSEVRIRMGIGQGYRVPDLKERGYIFDHSSIGYIVLGSEVDQWQDEQAGNIDLSGAGVLAPEESLSYQLGLEIIGAGGSRLDISLYRNEISNLIDSLLYEGDEVSALTYSVYRYTNIAEARTQGLDISYSASLLSGLDGDVSYSYLDAIDDNTGLKLTSRPDHQIQAGLAWSLPDDRTSLTLRAKWQSEEYVDADNDIESPAWHSLDLKFNFQYSTRLKLFAGIDNLTDEHQDPAAADQDHRPEEGRFLYVGLQFKNN